MSDTSYRQTRCQQEQCPDCRELAQLQSALTAAKTLQSALTADNAHLRQRLEAKDASRLFWERHCGQISKQLEAERKAREEVNESRNIAVENCNIWKQRADATESVAEQYGTFAEPYGTFCDQQLDVILAAPNAAAQCVEGQTTEKSDDPGNPEPGTASAAVPQVTTDKQTCGTCRFRGDAITRENEDYEEIPKGYFLCTQIKHDFEWKYVKGQGALVTDGSGYYVSLCVESDFGCAKWDENAKQVAAKHAGNKVVPPYVLSPGCVVVPEEPTPEMCVAGFLVSEAEHDPAGVYRAMLAAAKEKP